MKLVVSRRQLHKLPLILVTCFQNCIYLQEGLNLFVNFLLLIDWRLHEQDTTF